jgi:hypothetical protein
MWELSGNFEAGYAQKEYLVKKDFKYVAFTDSISRSIRLRNENSSFIKKAARGSLLVFGVEIVSFAALFVFPESVSKWDKSLISRENCWNNFKRAYTEPPIMDKDLWVVNYVGHPYQGAYFYNAVRSQRASFLQSSLFCFGHSMLWEYFTEAFFEQPSIQDLIVTPITGVICGELIHRATIRMSKNGFTRVEKALTILINPLYVLNNGFKPKTVKQR